MMNEQLTLTQAVTLYIRSLAGRNTSSLTILAYQTDLSQFLDWIKENDTTVTLPHQVERTHITDYLSYRSAC
jgi:site-specific recombinase XerD